MSDKNKEICACNEDEVKFIFACSGGADVGHLSDRAARKMMADGCGKMFCLAGIGGKVPSILKTTKDADAILAIDGCPVDCAKKSLERVGITNFAHFQVTALDFEKGQTAIDDAAIVKVAEYGKQLLT
ncbi:zinc-binding protein [candidate division KSB1 bacterium]|nr:zinc-binding protein [candidate division KSB1 bacterium]